jgi:hypothetical protein
MDFSANKLTSSCIISISISSVLYLSTNVIIAPAKKIQYKYENILFRMWWAPAVVPLQWSEMTLGCLYGFIYLFSVGIIHRVEWRLPRYSKFSMSAECRQLLNCIRLSPAWSLSTVAYHWMNLCRGIGLGFGRHWSSGSCHSQTSQISERQCSISLWWHSLNRLLRQSASQHR